MAVMTAEKKIDCSKAEFLTVEEGVCVQIMHIGSFDDGLCFKKCRMRKMEYLRFFAQQEKV